MQRFVHSFWTNKSMIVLFSMVVLLVFSTSGTQAASKRFAATPTLVVNANQMLRSVTHVASGGLYGLGSDSTPADSMVIPLHPRTFVQMAPGGHQLPNGEPVPGGDALVVAPKAARGGECGYSHARLLSQFSLQMGKLVKLDQRSRWANRRTQICDQHQ